MKSWPQNCSFYFLRQSHESIIQPVYWTMCTFHQNCKSSWVIQVHVHVLCYSPWRKKILFVIPVKNIIVDFELPNADKFIPRSFNRTGNHLSDKICSSLLCILLESVIKVYAYFSIIYPLPKDSSGQSLSSTCWLTLGMPQGSILGLSLFMYINDTHKCLMCC